MAAGDGLVTMTPTSVDKAGTSATINADGSVDFTAVTSLSLNGVFTGDYDNYLIVMRHTTTGGDVSINMRLRAAGTDNSTASSYTYQYLNAQGTNKTGVRASDSFAYFLGVTAENISGYESHWYGPYLAQPTAIRTVNALDYLNARILDAAITHNQSTSYDGFTMYPNNASYPMTGQLHVFGYEE